MDGDGVYLIVRREQLGPATFLMEVLAPDVANACGPGHFVMVRIDETGERIPLTIADFDRDAGTVTIVVQAVGKTTDQMMGLGEGSSLMDFIGPLGLPSRLERSEKVILVGGGLGVAPIFPQLRRLKELGTTAIAVLGFRSRDQIFWHDRFDSYADESIVTTEDGSFGIHGLVTAGLEQALSRNPDTSEVIAIGPLQMMQACAETTRPLGIRTMVSVNSIMVDGTGMCGSCRVTVGGQMRFACIHGPDFDGHQVDFDELALRMRRFRFEEKECLARYEAERQRLRELGSQGSNPAIVQPRRREFLIERLPVPVPEPPEDLRRTRNVNTVTPTRNPMPAQKPDERILNFGEVTLGYGLDAAIAEADRCIQCKKPKCIEGCPVRVDIPGFLDALRRKDLENSYRILKESNALPAVCGRVCPQEIQCEAACVVGKKRDPVAVGRLERFVADFAVSRGWDEPVGQPDTGRRVAVVGSGPAGLACAGDLVRSGVAVTVFEGLHVAGGVLKYGIPEFRLPNDIIDIEIDALASAGVSFELDKVIGNIFTVPQLITEKGYEAVFIASGAGSPKFMHIPGEALNGVVSASEFLTRVNLMQGFRQPLYDTPVGMGKRVAVVGAGNTAMDACRVALRMGAQEVRLVYRRRQEEAPARREELHHAIEEGVVCSWLTNPVRVLGNEDGWVTGIEVIDMEPGEPDESGRARPVPRPGTERMLSVDMVIPALGTSANPVIARTTPGLATNDRGYIEVDPETQMSSIPGVFAGGDIVTGSATVILAMGAGRRAAAGILRYLDHVDSEQARAAASRGRSGTAGSYEDPWFGED